VVTGGRSSRVETWERAADRILSVRIIAIEVKTCVFPIRNFVIVILLGVRVWVVNSFIYLESIRFDNFLVQRDLLPNVLFLQC
jgi:hypothetical protein